MLFIFQDFWCLFESVWYSSMSKFFFVYSLNILSLKLSVTHLRGLGKLLERDSRCGSLSWRCCWFESSRPSDLEVVSRMVWSFCYVIKMRERNEGRCGRLKGKLLVLRIHKGKVHNTILRYKEYCTQVNIRKELCYIWLLWQLLIEAFSWKLSLSLNTLVEMSIKEMV